MRGGGGGRFWDHPEPHSEKLSGKKFKAILTSLLLVLPAEVASIYTLIFFSLWLWVTFFFFVASLVVFLMPWILDITNVMLLNIWDVSSFSFKWCWLCFDKQATCFSAGSYPDLSLVFSRPHVILAHCRGLLSCIIKASSLDLTKYFGSNTSAGWVANILEVPCSVSLVSARPCCVLAWGIFILCMLSPIAGKDARVPRAD